MTAQPTSFGQRQPHPAAGLDLHERQPVARPVEIGELQSFDVDTAQPEPGEQQDDRVVTLPARVAPVNRLQDFGHVGRFQPKPPVCYRATRALPEPDSHRQATTSTNQQITPTRGHLQFRWAHERLRLDSVQRSCR